jgi:acetylornithine deacetylase
VLWRRCQNSVVAALTTHEARVLEAIDETQIVRTLATLVRIPSVDGTDAEHEVQAWVAAHLAELGLDVDHWRIDLDGLSASPGYPGMEVERTEAWGCVGILPGSDGTTTPALALSGHVDVVPPGASHSWHDDEPFSARIRGRTLWGRGSCDMKGGVAAALGAVTAIRRCGLALRHGLSVHSVVGEEDGGIGAYATLRREHLADSCISGEPTQGQIIPANAGALTFRLEVEGLSAHGSMRTQGVSAVDRFDVVRNALRDLETRRNRTDDPWFNHLDLPWPLSVGIVRAGDWASTVPGRLVAEGRYGVQIDEPVDVAKAEFERAIIDACDTDDWLRTHPVVVSWPGGMFGPGRLPSGHRLLEDMRRAAVDAGAGGSPAVRGGAYGSDLRQYIDAGVPTLQYGPGEVRHAHATDERVGIDAVLHCARAYALAAVRLCGTMG